LTDQLSPARTAKAIVSPEKQKNINDLTASFMNLKESFDRALSVETFKEVKSAGKQKSF
jgi:hypothetical protein